MVGIKFVLTSRDQVMTLLRADYLSGYELQSDERLTPHGMISTIYRLVSPYNGASVFENPEYSTANAVYELCVAAYKSRTAARNGPG
ncbi:MAG: hypothetical protein ACYDD1_05005 [Caulobacteraceae bacterium]